MTEPKRFLYYRGRRKHFQRTKGHRQYISILKVLSIKSAIGEESFKEPAKKAAPKKEAAPKAEAPKKEVKATAPKKEAKAAAPKTEEKKTVKKETTEVKE